MDLHRLNDSIAEMHLKFTSMANFSVHTNIVDLDQTALKRAV